MSELEGQVSFLERQRVDVWASATGGGLGAARPLKGNPPGVSRSGGGGGVSARKSGAFRPRVAAAAAAPPGGTGGGGERGEGGRAVAVAATWRTGTAESTGVRSRDGGIVASKANSRPAEARWQEERSRRQPFPETRGARQEGEEEEEEVEVGGGGKWEEEHGVGVWDTAETARAGEHGVTLSERETGMVAVDERQGRQYSAGTVSFARLNGRSDAAVSHRAIRPGQQQQPQQQQQQQQQQQWPRHRKDVVGTHDSRWDSDRLEEEQRVPEHTRTSPGPLEGPRREGGVHDELRFSRGRLEDGRGGEGEEADDVTEDVEQSGGSGPWESSWGAQRAASDGAKYDPMRYRTADGTGPVLDEADVAGVALVPNGTRAVSRGGDGQPGRRTPQQAVAAQCYPPEESAREEMAARPRPGFRDAVPVDPHSSFGDVSEDRHANGGGGSGDGGHGGGDCGGGGSAGENRDWRNLEGGGGGSDVQSRPRLVPASPGESDPARVGRSLAEGVRHEPRAVSGPREVAGFPERGGSRAREALDPQEASLARSAEVGASTRASVGAGPGEGRRSPGGGGKVERVLRDGRRVVLFANGTQKVCLDRALSC